MGGVYVEMNDLDPNELSELVKTLEDLAEYEETHKLEFYIPYPFQKAFHHAESKTEYPNGQYEVDYDSNYSLAVQRALMAGNQSGKTLSAAFEVAMHCTGQYPEWWKGQRFERAINCVVAGKSNDSVRDVVQNELLGDPFSETAEGTGAIPKDCIGKTTRKAGVPNAKSAVMIKHVSGKWSKIRFMAYEQGPDPYMGIKFDLGWLDEEPPQDVWTQFIRGTISRKIGEYQLMLTFTPEEGVTEVVDGFMNNLTTGQALIRAGWNDAAHMTQERQAELMEQLPPHERDMRSKGIPLMGSGLVFPVNEDDIKCEPFHIPAYWPCICGIDFGWDHPFAAVWIAWDRDKDIVYVYDVYRVSKALPPMHASAIKKRGAWIPIAWPHDGLNTDKASGIPLASQYRQEGLQLLPSKFSNPPSPNQKEGQGGNGVEAGLFDMLTRMNEGRLKVFSNLQDWFEEKRQYHRKDGKVVALRDDLMSASRYAIMSTRFASIQPQPRKVVNKRQGLSNW